MISKYRIMTTLIRGVGALYCRGSYPDRMIIISSYIVIYCHMVIIILEKGPPLQIMIGGALYRGCRAQSRVTVAEFQLLAILVIEIDISKSANQHLSASYHWQSAKYDQHAHDFYDC